MLCYAEGSSKECSAEKQHRNETSLRLLQPKDLLPGGTEWLWMKISRRKQQKVFEEQMEANKVQIGLLEGKLNWSTWKYKLCILLSGVKGGLEVLEGKLQAPKPLVENASQEEKSSYVKQADEDIATHTCELKNLWNSLQKEISKEKVTYGRTCNCDLPEILLICKILETSPAEYFSFKSSWNLMSDTDKNIDNLTSQLCAYGKALTMKCETRQEVLQTTASRRKNLTCNYCKLKGHKVRDCVK
ncbi:hypothetical protein JTB14_006393 [Gonioctena quinquepunctata]|nr:hypothetical protein JTB14_006393 [Gonioctena quinquepunctata]